MEKGERSASLLPEVMSVAGSETTERQRMMQCMEIWGGNNAFDNAVSVPGVDAWVYSRPHADAAKGGDVHYVSMCGCGEVARFFLADLSGHGESASEPAAEVRRLMRRYINTFDQTRFVRALNERMLRWQRSGLFATLLLTTYFAPTREMLICNAGHPAPLWYRARDGVWGWLTSSEAEHSPQRADNLPVGVVQGTKYEQFAVKLEAGDRILIFSDSLFEARNADGAQLGLEGLRDLANDLRNAAPQDQEGRLLRRIAEHKGSDVFDDDLTVMLLHHHGEGRVEQGIGDRLRTMGRMLGLLRV